MYKMTIGVRNIPVLVEAFPKAFPGAVKLGPNKDGDTMNFSLEGEGLPDQSELTPFLAVPKAVFGWAEIPMEGIPVLAKGAFAKAVKAAKERKARTPKPATEGEARRPGRPSKEALAKRAQEEAHKEAARMEFERAQENLKLLCSAVASNLNK